jgi:hypothetical protein
VKSTVSLLIVAVKKPRTLVGGIHSMSNKRQQARQKAEGHWLFELLTKQGFKTGDHQNKKDKRTRTRQAKKTKAIKDFD